MKHKAAVILAAGSGKRMGSDIPKQFLPLCGRPVLYWTLRAFEQSRTEEIVLVVSDDDAKNRCEEMIREYAFQKICAIIRGGNERYDSVWQGLLWLGGRGENDPSFQRPEYVAVHDGARCLVTPSVIDRTFEDAMTHKAAVAAMPVKDTIKVVDEKGYVEKTPDRRRLWQMQTPQTFAFSEIYSAYEGFMKMDPRPAVTDDAEVEELVAHKKAFLTQGSYENLKITTPEDMILAEALLRKRGDPGGA